MQKNKASTSGKRKVNDNSSDQQLTKKTKEDNVLKNNGEDENTEREEEGIMHDFDYHDTINAESYEKYFENICKLLKPNSVIIIDNTSYHSRNNKDFPVSKWQKAQFQSWLTENKISFYTRCSTIRVMDALQKNIEWIKHRKLLTIYPRSMGTR